MLFGAVILRLLPGPMSPVVSASNHAAQAIIARAADATAMFHTLAAASPVTSVSRAAPAPTCSVAKSTAIALRAAFEAAVAARARATAELLLRCLLAVLSRFGGLALLKQHARVVPVDAATMRAATAAAATGSAAVAIAVTAAAPTAAAKVSPSSSSSSTLTTTPVMATVKCDSATHPTEVAPATMPVIPALPTAVATATPTATPTATSSPAVPTARERAAATLARSVAARARAAASHERFLAARARADDDKRKRALAPKIDLRHPQVVDEYTIAHDDALLVATAEALSSRHAALGPVPSDTVLKLLGCLYAANDGCAFELDAPFAVDDVVLRVLKGNAYDVHETSKRMVGWVASYRALRISRAMRVRRGDVAGVARADALLGRLTHEFYASCSA